MSLNTPVKPKDFWQANIDSIVLDTNSDELKSWISTDKLKPNHKVKLGNLQWIDAETVPAFRTIFEAKKNAEIEAKKNIPVFQLPELKVLPDIPEVKPVEKKAESVEASMTFKLYEEKLKAKTQQSEVKTVEPKSDTKTELKPLIDKPSKPVINKGKKSSVVKTLGFLAGCILTLSISYGGSYFWAYYLKSKNVNEKNIVELTGLEDKLSNDRVGLRLKIANNEQQLQTSNNNQADLTLTTEYTQELNKLQKQHDINRKIIIENHQKTLLENSFNNSFAGSSVVLMILFLLIRILFGRTNNQVETVPLTKSPNLETTISENIELSDSLNIQTTTQPNAHITSSPNIHTTNSSNKLETLEEFLKTSDYLNLVANDKSKYCLQHKDQPSEFSCEICSNYFCAECLITVGIIENSCPFCRVGCVLVGSQNSQVPQIQIIVAGELKATSNLKPKIKENVNFTIYDDAPKQRVGIISMFFIAFLFSISIGYFWVFQISPMLVEKKADEPQIIALKQPQSVTENSAKNDGQVAPATSANGELANVPGITPDGRCIDSKSKEVFECDEAVKMVIMEEATKKQSVANAQQQVSEKTNLILGSILPSESPSPENASQETQTNSQENNGLVEEYLKSEDNRSFLQIFIGSFIILFGAMLTGRFLRKD